MSHNWQDLPQGSKRGVRMPVGGSEFITVVGRLNTIESVVVAEAMFNSV